jgi:hypothetical protein
MININGKCYYNKENNISIEINKEGTEYKGTFNGVPKNGKIKNAVYMKAFS